MTTAGVIGMPTIISSSAVAKYRPNDKINIAQIGFGRIAQTHDLPETIKHDMCRFVAVADPDINRAKDGKKWIDGYYAQKTGKAKYMDKKDGYYPYNVSFANNANHTLTTPVIHYTGDGKATMFLNALNRSVERWISDNRVPMWSIIIFWEKNEDSWQIVGGKSFYESR